MEAHPMMETQAWALCFQIRTVRYSGPSATKLGLCQATSLIIHRVQLFRQLRNFHRWKPSL